MITAQQIRAARAMLTWTQEALADKAMVSLTALKRLEQGLRVYDSTADQVRRALEEAGIIFISSGHVGVMIDAGRISGSGKQN